MNICKLLFLYFYFIFFRLDILNAVQYALLRHFEHSYHQSLNEAIQTTKLNWTIEIENKLVHQSLRPFQEEQFKN